jgi:hypothetical protein
MTDHNTRIFVVGEEVARSRKFDLVAANKKLGALSKRLMARRR